MDPLDVTVGLPVSEIARSVEWYRRAFELREPDLEPVEGVVEFRFGPIWTHPAQARHPADRW